MRYAALLILLCSLSLEVFAQPNPDGAPSQRISPDTTFYGKWEGGYLDYNKRSPRPIEIIIDSGYGDERFGTLILDGDRPEGWYHAYTIDTCLFSGKLVGDTLKGVIHGVPYVNLEFYLKSSKVERLLYDDQSSARVYRFHNVLDGYFRNKLFNVYTMGPVMLWKR